MAKAVSAQELLALFHKLDKRLIAGFYSFSSPAHKFDLLAIGGTALELLDCKQVSKDIDLLILFSSLNKLTDPPNTEAFAEKLARFIKEYFDGSEGINADVNYEGVKSWNLLGFPINTLLHKEEFLCFSLYIMDPLDVCITKLARYNADDAQDVEEVFRRVRPTPEQLESRFLAYLPRLKQHSKEALVRSNFEKVKSQLKTP